MNEINLAKQLSKSKNSPNMKKMKSALATQSAKVNDNHFPHLPEKEINKLVEELTDPSLSPLSSWSTEEELLLLRVLERKLKEGVIKAEMSKDGKLWLKISHSDLEGIIQVKYQSNTK